MTDERTETRKQETIHPPPPDSLVRTLPDVAAQVLVNAIRDANEILLKEQRDYFERMLQRQEKHHDAQNKQTGLAFDEAMKTLKMIADQSLENHSLSTRNSVAIEKLTERVTRTERRLDDLTGDGK